MQALTTIIMPAYNAQGFIGEAIESVLAQTRGDWLLSIVDDGSTDDTYACATSYNDPRITVTRQDNAGAGAARNCAARAANTPFIAMLDADDMWAADYLEQMIGALEADPRAAFAACDAYEFRAPDRTVGLCSDGHRMIPPITLARVAARAFNVYTAVAMRRDWFDAVGGFDEAMINAQDFDLWLRLLAAGGKGLFVEAPLARYRLRPGSLSSDTTRLSRYTIRAFEKLSAARSDMAAICEDQIDRLRYQIDLDLAKKALREGRFAEFREKAQDALERRANPKLRAALHLTRVAPPLAQRLACAVA